MASALNGGIAAPRGRRRPAVRIPGARPLGPLPVNPQGRGMLNPPGQGPGVSSPAAPQRRLRSAPGRGRVNPQGGGGQGKGPGVGGAALTGPGGRQLASRVSSGKITQEQADRTLAQRSTLKKAFGDDWRTKLSVGGKSFADVNQGLKKNPQDPRLVALRKKLLANRSAMVTAAKAKTGKKKPAVASAAPASTIGE